MNHIKTNPKGIDKPIQRIQNKLYNELGFENMDGYGRVYLIEKQDKTIPAYFLKGKDYKDVLTDDKLDAQFFFVEKPITEVNGPQGSTIVDIIFLLNVKKLKPSVPYRADEEVRIQIKMILDKMKFFHLKEIIRGKKALEDFNTDLLDMQPYHFIKFTGTLNYNINNC